MSSLDHGITEGTGFAFSIARRIAMALLKRSIKRRLRVIVEQEVQAAVLQHLEALQKTQPAGFTQIVVGEVYNVAERFEGVVRIGDALHLEESAVSVEPVAIDDPRLNVLVQRAQARLDAVSVSGANRRPDADPLLPIPPPAKGEVAPTAPTFDAKQRLSYRTAERYRERLEQIAHEDQVR
jgi:hypothetical protein